MKNLWFAASLLFLPLCLLAQQEGMGFQHIDSANRIMQETEDLHLNPFTDSFTDFSKTSISLYLAEKPSLHIPLRKPNMLPYVANSSPLFRGVELGTLTMEVQSLIEEQIKASSKINKAKKKKTFHTSCLFNRKLLLLPANRFRG